jgi:ribonuclease HI
VLVREIRTRRLGSDPATGQHEKELMGGEKATTNNRMELTAVIEGLKALKNASSRHHPYRLPLCDGRGVEMALGWKNKGWKTADKKPVKNEDLWRAWMRKWRATTSIGCGWRAIPAIRRMNAPSASAGCDTGTSKSPRPWRP